MIRYQPEVNPRNRLAFHGRWSAAGLRLRSFLLEYHTCHDHRPDAVSAKPEPPTMRWT